MATKFVHLHTHSHYSLLDGLSKIGQLVELAVKDGAPAIGLTDHGNMYGAIEFYKECTKAGIKPIIGVEAYIATGSRHDKNPGIDNRRFHLTLLAKNNTGYKNLLKLVTLSNLEGYYYKPRMDRELLRTYSEGLICLSGCFGGELSRAFRAGNDEEAERIALDYQAIFGKENYFLEIMHHPGVEGIEEVRAKILALSKKIGIPIVGTQDSHYPNSDDRKAHETLLAVQTNADLKSNDRFSMGTEDYSFINTKTALEYFKDIPEAVENTAKVAEMCNVELDLTTWLFPDIPIPEGESYDSELKKQAYAGVEKKGLKKEDLVERIEYELKIIKDKDYSSYFLVVADLLNFSKENGIFTNTRGSAAGSLVSYLIGITSVNPIELNLPFERFLNPGRPSLPDIDMDFADNRRDEVIEYAKRKYGEDKVAQIGTFGAMLARGAVRDVARALGYEYAIGDKISRLIPIGSQGFPMTIKRAMEMTPELKDMYKKDETTKEIIDLAKKLEGCVRHVSVHAAGVVIAPRPLTDFTPLQYDPHGGKIITQYDMYTGNREGIVNLPKFDFLGIRNLTILADAVERVKQLHGITVDINNLPYDDKKTYAMLARGETMGVFQLSGSGMTRYLKELKPTTINDINAMVALYRPGPMAFIPDYIKRKENPQLVKYIDPRLKDILEATFGILIYQDDILMIATKLAGYSWGEADKFRKAVGKKIPEAMAEQEKKFITGCVDNGMKPNVAQELWEMIETFAAYGFNKAHAASYGNLAYQTAYMKANFPVEYMAAVLTADSGEVEKIAEIIGECARMKIPVLPPDVNKSFGKFTVVKDKENNKDEIRFGLYTIKNLGTDISNAIIEEREENGEYTSFSDFLERIKHKNLNKKSLEALIKSGAMDEMGERGQMFANIEEALAYNRECAKEPSEQVSLFESMDTSALPHLRLKEVNPIGKNEKLAWEKELLGLYISGHPIDQHREKLEKLGITIKKLKTLNDGSRVIAAGVIEEAKTVSTKKGDQMAFMRIADHTDSIETVLFPKVFLAHKELLESKEGCIKLKGRMSERNGEKSIIVEAIAPLENKTE